MNNIEITKNIISNNIHGSFMNILWRESKKSQFDFIDPLRISIYHHLILKEGKTFTFPDILESSESHNSQEFHFNNLDSNYSEDADYFFCGREIKNNNTTPEECYNTFAQILENRSRAIIEAYHPLYRKLCGYKVNVMKGEKLPIYGIKIIHSRFKTFDLLSGDDILGDLKLKRLFIKQFKQIL